MANPPSKRSLPVRNFAVTVLCLVLDELFESSIPRNFLFYYPPLETNAVEPIDAALLELVIPVCSALCAYPCSKFSLLRGNVAVTVLCLVLDELIESSLPWHVRALLFPLKADAAESIDAILCKRFGPVGSSLTSYPLSKLALGNWDVAVAVLRSIIQQLLESRVPFNVFVLHLTTFSLLLQARRRNFSTATTLP